MLSVRLGHDQPRERTDVLQPVLRLDVSLLDDDTHQLGLLARLRDVLPGHYAFGLTGRGPDGRAACRARTRCGSWPGRRPAVRP